MRKIFLTDGQFTLVSEEDFLFLAGYNWWVHKKDNYVRCSSRTDGLNSQLMHRIIAKRMKIDCFNEIDHIDQDKLNNQRNNLRPASKSQNQANSKIKVDNTSGYKGVHWAKGRWVARIQVGKQRINLGVFDTPENASLAYQIAADHYFGEFANY